MIDENTKYICCHHCGLDWTVQGHHRCPLCGRFCPGMWAIPRMALCEYATDCGAATVCEHGVKHQRTGRCGDKSPCNTYTSDRTVKVSCLYITSDCVSEVSL